MAETGIFHSNIKVFIAGILIYPLSVTIQSSFNESPKATIAVPADVRLFNLGRYDRVPVQIFVLESMVESGKYILMFEGFISGRTYANTASERQIVFTCVSFTEVFNDTKLKFITSIDENTMCSVPGNTALTVTVFKPEIMFPQCLFYEGLGYATEGNESFTASGIIKMPTQYLANIMEFLEEAGFGYAPAGRHNDSIVARYYAILSTNLHFDRRFCWLPFFDVPVEGVSEDFAWKFEGISEDDVKSGKASVMFPILYGVQGDQAVQHLTASIQASTKEYTMHDLIYFLIDRMEYDFLVVNNPAFQKAQSLGTDIGAELDHKKPVVLTDDLMSDSEGVSAKSPVNDGDVQEVMEIMKKRYDPRRDCDRLVQFCVKPMLDDTFPPACNIVFRSQVTSLNCSTQFNGCPTRIQVCNFNRVPPGTDGTNDMFSNIFGGVDFYPCEDYGNPVDTSENARSTMSYELLPIEKRTGPWITRDRAPDWLFYTMYGIAFATATEDDPVIEQIKKMREQYMRRQLIRTQVLNRQLTAQCVFLPYITCGFPAVFFDAANTGFAFVGNVIAIEHHISPTDMSTSVVINGVRLLSEAATDEQDGRYPNPINSVHAVTHSKDNISKVYQCILGYPEGNDYPGANAYTWDEIIEKWYGKVNDAASSPQTNIYKAYQVQKRNIATLEQYADFMGMSYNGTDLSSEWLNDRTKLATQNSIPLKQKILPVDLKGTAESENKAIAQKKAELEKKVQEAKNAAQKAQEAYNKGLSEKEAQVKAAQEKVSALNTEMSKTENPSDKLKHDYNEATNNLNTVYTDYQNYQKTEKAKADEVVKKQNNLIEGYNKEISQLNKGSANINAQANASKSDDNFSNVSERDVRELLTEIRAKSEKHYIY